MFIHTYPDVVRSSNKTDNVSGGPDEGEEESAARPRACMGVSAPFMEMSRPNSLLDLAFLSESPFLLWLPFPDL
jgi:hypothetical protein